MKLLVNCRTVKEPQERDLEIPVFKCTANPKIFRNNGWLPNELCECKEVEQVDDLYDDHYDYDDDGYDYYQSDYYGDTFVMDGDDIVGDR